MNKNKMKVIVAVVVISSMILSCSSQTTAQPPSIQPPFTQPAPTLPISSPTDTAAATSEPPHDIYAGFTENNSMPFVMIHRSGEKLFVTEDINSSTISGAVWNSVDGKSLVIYSDSNGRPESAVIGNTIVQYSNYTTNTVDLTIIYADGTRETLPANLDIDLMNKITAFAPASYALASYAKSAPRQSQQWLNYAKAGLFAFGTASCVVTIYAPMYPLLLLPLAEACAGSLLTAVVLAGNVLNLDMSDIQTFSDNWDIYMCHQGMDITACLSVLVTDAEKRKAEADAIKSNPHLPPATVTPIPTITRIPTATQFIPTAAIEKLIPSDVTVYSTWNNDEANYGRLHLIDGNTNTIWISGQGGVGVWIDVLFGSSVRVTSINIFSLGQPDNGGAIQTAELSISNYTQEIELGSAKGWYHFDLPEPIQTTDVYMSVDSLYPGTTYDDVIIAEIEVYGYK